MSTQIDAIGESNADAMILPMSFHGDSVDDDFTDAHSLSTAEMKPVERILIFRLGSLGDTVVALPCFHKLAKSFPNAERYVMTNVPVSSKAAPLNLILRNSGLINGVVDYPIGMRSFKDVWNLASRLRALQVTTLIYLTPPKGRLAVYRDILFFRLIGFRRIIGAPTARDLQVDQVDEATGDVEYECSRLARSLAGLGSIDLDNPQNWDLRLTDAEKEVAERALTPFNGIPFIAINMGGKVKAKHWGQANWRELFRKLSTSHGGYGLLFLGAADEAETVAEVLEAWPNSVVNACGKLLPRESAAALSKASLFLGHDSGPMHLAAAAGVICVALFGSLNQARKWHPYGAKHKIIHHVDGITTIGVDEVAAQITEVLAASVNASSSDFKA